MTTPALPDLYGEGALFAYSGVDGPTNACSGFVATFLAEPGLLLQTPVRRTLRLANLPAAPTATLATGDVLAFRLADAPDDILITWHSWHTLLGRCPASIAIQLATEDGTPATANGDLLLSCTSADTLALARRGDIFALSYATTPEEAATRARAALAADPRALVPDRLTFIRRVPALADPARDRLLRKCLSVMKVNTLTPEGPIIHRWSTPDRVPHRDMWIWDSVFHSLAMNHLDPRLAADFLLAVLDVAKPDGMIPHQTAPTGWQSTITQPPLLAWGLWHNYQRLQDKAVLEHALPKLEGYLEWDLAYRDKNHNHLLEWFIEDSPKCRSGESGLDNSQRFDEAVLMDAVDFSVFIAQDMAHLAKIAGTLGNTPKARAWCTRAHRVASQVHALLWHEDLGLYVDRHMDGRLSSIRAVTGFMPLLLADLPADRLDRLLANLHDPAHFACPCPLPSIAISDPNWSTDMWRGSTWLNMNYFVILGLRQHGRHAEAAALKEQTIAFVQKYFERFGVVFEFYDPRDLLPPTKLDRKGPHQEPYNFRRKYDSIRDYHWTAAITACLLLEKA